MTYKLTFSFGSQPTDTDGDGILDSDNTKSEGQMMGELIGDSHLTAVSIPKSETKLYFREKIFWIIYNIPKLCNNRSFFQLFVSFNEDFQHNKTAEVLQKLEKNDEKNPFLNLTLILW